MKTDLCSDFDFYSMKRTIKSIIGHLIYRIRIEESRSLEINSILIEGSTNDTKIKYLPDEKWSTDTYMMICGGLIVSLFVITVARSITFYNFFAAASQNLHDMMFRGLISTNMRFFDKNSSGRIMNRFASNHTSKISVINSTCQ